MKLETAAIVTDHALIRYLERVRGFDLDRSRAEIRDICRGIKNGTVKLNGCNFEVKNGYVVTIAPSGREPSATKRREVMGEGR